MKIDTRLEETGTDACYRSTEIKTTQAEQAFHGKSGHDNVFL